MPNRLIQHYIGHRRGRHQKVLEAVRGGLNRLVDIAKQAYQDTPDAHPGLAVDQTLSHLLALKADGTVVETSDGWTNVVE